MEIWLLFEVCFGDMTSRIEGEKSCLFLERIRKTCEERPFCQNFMSILFLLPRVDFLFSVYFGEPHPEAKPNKMVAILGAKSPIK